MTWTEERVTRLKELQAQRFSAGAMASELGLTRNAVMGKLRRLGLHPISQPAPQSVPRKPRRKREHTAVVRLPKPALWIAIEPAPKLSDADIPLAQRRTFGELREGECKWPVGDPQQPDFFFCGGARLGQFPYCAAHCRLAYQPVPARRGVVIPMRRAA